MDTENKREQTSGCFGFIWISSVFGWNSKDLLNLDRYVDRCRETFPDRPVYLGRFF